MRDVYRRTRPLPREEWEQYWAFEHINRRGVAVDVPFVRRAAALVAEDAVAIGRRLAELTGGVVTSVGQAKRIATWMHDQLADAEMREVLTLGVPDDDDEDDELELSLKRDRVERVLAMLEAKHANGGLAPGEDKAFEVATLRLYGAGASPKKFARLDAQQVDGVLRDQYRFAGAGQTGRMSSKGAQIQNLARDVLGPDGADEAALVDTIADGCSYSALVAANPVDMPAARKLALLVRPGLIAGPGKVFVWSDWSAIEARITPWLAASPGGEKVLDIFRANDRDPTRPDIYMIAAADILHKNDPSGVTKTERAIGKVAILALGFGGSVGALKSMALNYRIHLDDAEARRIVDAWRAANPWAREFWGAHRDDESFGLWGAAMTRLGDARPDHHGGSARLRLPRGLSRRHAVHGVAVGPPADLSASALARRRRSRQGRQADRREAARAVVPARPRAREAMARHALRERGAGHCRRPPARDGHADRDEPGLAFMPIRMTTHDEIVCEVDVARADEAKAILRREMLTLPAWADRAADPIGGIHLRVLHEGQGSSAISAPPRVLRSYQERAATFLYEREAGFFIAPLGAGKGAAALTAGAELIRDGHRRHILVIAPKLVATTVWPAEVAAWPHLRHLRIAVLDGSPQRRRALLATAAERQVTVIGIDLVQWLVS